MPKMKTNRGARKRFRKTGGSKIKRAQANRRHLLTSKSRDRKRNSRAVAYVAPADVAGILRLLPN